MPKCTWEFMSNTCGRLCNSCEKSERGHNMTHPDVMSSNQHEELWIDAAASGCSRSSDWRPACLWDDRDGACNPSKGLISAAGICRECG
eukprot:364590-Chlamydomonas_euryale.AAC.11